MQNYKLMTALADVYFERQDRRWVFPLVSTSLLLAGLGLALLVPLSKHRASASYVLLSLGLSALGFYLFERLVEKHHWRLPSLADWGRNPLLLYLLHYVVLAFFALPPAPAWYVQADLWLVVFQIAALIGILTWVGSYLNWRKLYFVI